MFIALSPKVLKLRWYTVLLAHNFDPNSGRGSVLLISTAANRQLINNSKNLLLTVNSPLLYTPNDYVPEE